MGKSAAERKAEQRKRQAAAGNHKIELILDDQELVMLDHDCAARRPGRDPYDRSELIALMIRKFHGELKKQLEVLVDSQCEKCHESLPVNDCPCKGDAKCWTTSGWHKVKLTIDTP